MIKKDISDYSIAVSLPLITANYDLSASEKSIVYIVLAGIDQGKELDKEKLFRVTVAEFASIRGTTLQNARESLKHAAEQLYRRELAYKDKDERVWKLRWVITSSFNEKEDFIELQWHPSIVPQLVELKDYCTIKMIEVGSFTSKYTSRIWELIATQSRFKKKTGTVTIFLEDFVNMIEAKGVYREFKYVKRDILVPVIKELEAKKLAKVVLTVGKTGRKVDKIHLNWAI